MDDVVRCPACGRVVDAGDRFCSSCGARTDAAHSPVAARKLVSALFVDLVGYTALSESLDPEDSRRLLDRYWTEVREEIERHGGTVEKFIGDAVVGLFGAPQAHDDDAERAVRAALSVLERSRDRPVRIGVATGIALVDIGARPEAGEALVVGDVVTTAARLQQSAPPGGLLVDRATRAATRDIVTYGRPRALAAKGKREPLPAWRVLRLRAAGPRPPRGPRFVGRRHELALLQEVAARTEAAPGAGLVTVVGEPGIGKSRLVRELPRRGARWEGRVLPYGEGSAFAPLAELVKEQAGITAEQGPGEASASLARFLTPLLPQRRERVRVEQHLRRLVGLDPVASADASLEGFVAFRRLLEAVAAREPLLVVFEDVHWADDALLDFVDHVLEWAAPVPLLLLCTARPELLQRRPHWGGGTSNAVTLTLTPLPDGETRQLAADVLGRVPTAGEAEALLRRAGGNPLYAEHLSRMLRERGVLDEEVPETVHAVIAARLDRLPNGAKQLLGDAAVIGNVFPAAAVAALAPRAPDEIEAALHELERAGFLERCPAEGTWAFRHRLVREVAYGELPRPERVARHVLVAEWLETRPRQEELAELVGHHYLRGHEEARAGNLPAAGLAGRARQALARAAERALGLSAFGAAVRLYGQVLDLWPAAEPGRAAQLLRYATALWNAEVGGEAIALEARDTLAAAGEAEGAAEAETLLSEMRWYRGDRASAAAHLERAVELVAERPPSPAHARVVSRLARSQMLAARYEEAIANGRKVLELAKGYGMPELQADALNTIGSARARSGDAGGLEDVRRAIRIADSSRAAVVAYNNLSALLMEQGDVCGADEAQQRGRELAEHLGDRLHLAWFEAEAIGRRFGRGEWEEALVDADRWLAGGRHPGYASIGVLATRGFVRHARGEAGAREDLVQAVKLARAAGDPQTLVPTLAESAFVFVDSDRPREGRRCAAEALELCRRIGEVPPLAAFDLAVACAATGQDEELRALLDRSDDESRWLRVAGLYLDGRLGEALDLVSNPENAWLAARIRLRSAELGGAGLDAAREYYDGVGAARYVALCDTLRKVVPSLAS